MVRFPNEKELQFWVESLSENLKPYLPEISDDWFDRMLSCFQVTALRPDCRDNACRAGAVVFHKIIKNHHLVNGNKRSAVICTYFAFLSNGLHLSVVPESLYSIAKTVAESREDPEAVIARIEALFSSSCRTAA